ncbi:MAG TPA: hypothetical protein PK771_09715, partial [Spirochaetota bacterium]|nr:hypothetical protein [Spirochaetota bacterium]
DATVNKIIVDGKVELIDPLTGEFSSICKLSYNNSPKKISLSCENGNGEMVDLSFIARIVDSKNGLWGIGFKDGSDDKTFVNGVLDTTTDSLNLSGYIYGLENAIAGYEVYTKVIENGISVDKLLRNGLFDLKEKSKMDRSTLNWAVPLQEDKIPEKLEKGYEYARFYNQKISLSPGEQFIKIYTENPGGYRTEYKINGNYPILKYNLPIDKQKIVVINNEFNDIIPAKTYNDIPLLKVATFDISETRESPYKFKKTYIINGEVRSLNKVHEIKVRSYNSSVTFENGAQDIIIPVNSINRFSVPITINMLNDRDETDDYYISFVPTAPFLNFLKTAIKIECKKDYQGAYIVPDFNSLKNFTEAERQNLSKIIKVGFTRYIPSGSDLTLLVNYSESITGKLTYLSDESGKKIYTIRDSDSKDLSIDVKKGLKYGRNRIHWEIDWKNNKKISSSYDGRSGMTDFEFDIERIDTDISTNIVFNVQANVYYDDKAGERKLPNIVITKYPSTRVNIKLNGYDVLNDNKSDTINKDLVGQERLKEGRNEVVIEYKEGDSPEITKTYTFLYDSKAPSVNITSYSYDSNYFKLKEFTVNVIENNFSKAILYLGSSVIDHPSDIKYLGEDKYQISWTNLDTYAFIDIIPSKDTPLIVKAFDHSGRTGENVGGFGGLGVVDRPKDVKAEPMKPDNYKYKGDYGFTTYNEIGYNGKKFPTHFKFFNSSIGLRGTSDPSDPKTNPTTQDLTIIRPEKVSVGNTFSVDNAKTLRIESKNIGINSKFYVKNGSKLNLINSNILKIDNTEFSHMNTSNAITFMFRFRYEHEDFYNPEFNYKIDGKDYAIKRILTILESSDKTKSLYLAYVNSDDKKNYENKYLTLVYQNGEDGESLLLNFAPGLDSEILSLFPQLNFTATGQEDWHWVSLSYDSVNNTFTIALDNNPPFSFTHYVNWSAICNKDAKYYFGAKDMAHNGHFSIAEPFYV